MTITIQKTSKRIKAHIALSALTFAIGLLLVTSRDNDTATVGGLLAFFGLIWLVVAKIAKWWNHA